MQTKLLRGNDYNLVLQINLIMACVIVSNKSNFIWFLTYVKENNKMLIIKDLSLILIYVL